MDTSDRFFPRLVGAISHSVRLLIVATTLSTYLCGCSQLLDVLNGTSQSSVPKNPDAATPESQPLPKEKRLGLQVTWQVPSEPVDGFIIRYGESAESLKREKRVPTDSLQQEDDPEFGPVYKYTIADIDTKSALYVSVAAYKGDRLSEFSQVVKDSSR